jgi:hypothetical protein
MADAHIKIDDTVPRLRYVVGATPASTFVISFPFFETTDIAVFVGDVQLGSAAYTVDGTNPQTGGYAGGTVSLSAPVTDTVVTVLRDIPVKRLSDFLRSGEFNLDSLNSELDKLVAMSQQRRVESESAIRVSPNAAPANLYLPAKPARAGRALVFDNDGNVTVGTIGSSGPQLGDFLQPKPEAVGRTANAKLADLVSVKDFGAMGDGEADDTPAFLAALFAAQSVFIPEGVYRTTGTLTLRYGQTLFGTGEGSVIQARDNAFDPNNLPSYPSAFNAIEIVDSYCTVRDLRIVGGATAIKLYGDGAPCVKNTVDRVSLWDCINGLVLDGYLSPDFPCYWNNFSRVLVARHQFAGVLLTIVDGGAGDSPNANKFHDVRVYSLGAPCSYGFNIVPGRYHNSFVDCEANLHTDALACMRFGFGCDENRVVNFYAECLGLAPAILLENGAQRTSIINLFTAAGGAAIFDPSNARDYTAYNAGADTKNYLKKSRVTDLFVEQMTQSTAFIDAAGALYQPDLSKLTYLVSAFAEAVEFRLPDAGDAVGRVVRVKKTDVSQNAVTITESGGSGPDNRDLILANTNDFAELVSNGANWYIVSGNTVPGNAGSFGTSGLFEPTCQQNVYLISALTADVEVRLPAPGTPSVIGRTLTVKKTDNSANDVTVTQASGDAGPDGAVQTLDNQHNFLTVFSDGVAWRVIGRG